MKKKTLLKSGLALGLVLTLTACGGNEKKDVGGTTTGSEKPDSEVHTAAIITDVGGVDDKSFNQGAWEGLEEWGKENDLEKGVNGYDYFQSTDASEYTTNLDQAIAGGFETVFGIGYLLTDAVSAAADQNPETQFGLVDAVIEGKDNVVSLTFQDNEAAYLAGIAAAYSTKTDKVAFIGGEEGPVIDRFEAGFVTGVEAGAKELDKDIKVDVQYAASFGDPAKGKSLAANMYQNGADIIYHASGGTGVGVFQEAKDLNEKKSADDRVWVIGVDRDQEDDGNYKDKEGKEENFTLTSSVKGVGAAVKDVTVKAQNGEFPGGDILVYGLKQGGVDLTEGHLDEKALKAVEKARKEVIDGDVKVPETPTK